MYCGAARRGRRQGGGRGNLGVDEARADDACCELRRVNCIEKRNLAIKRGITPLPGGLITRFGRPTAFFRAGLDRYYSAGKTEALGQAPQNGPRQGFAIDSWAG